MRTPPGSTPQQILPDEQIGNIGFSSHETVADEKNIRAKRIRAVAGLIVPFGSSIKNWLVC
jgi:hypothetical protein